MNSREQAISDITKLFDNGSFTSSLGELISKRTESQNPHATRNLHDYLDITIRPMLSNLGFESTIFDNPVCNAGPIMISTRMESPDLPTVLLYGHGDVVLGNEIEWADSLTPFNLQELDDKIYGRGTSDNKGQHLINITALSQVIATRGNLGFNVKILMEMSEEIGSTGLREFCEIHKQMLEADVFIASDAPRLRPDVPTLYLGSRGAFPLELSVKLRDSSYHSGNFGGLLADPAIILANAIASITNQHGKLLVDGWRPNSLTPKIRNVLANLPNVQANIPLDEEWGEPGLTPVERVFGWNSFAVLAMISGNPQQPINAIAGEAKAYCQLRYVVGTEVDQIVSALQTHLDERGFTQVTVSTADKGAFSATRLDPDNKWVRFVTTSIEESIGISPDILPNIGGSVPNDCFADILGLPTLWLPHSYAGCCQHAANEHNLKPLCRQALQMMTGIFWDLGTRPVLP